MIACVFVVAVLIVGHLLLGLDVSGRLVQVAAVGSLVLIGQVAAFHSCLMSVLYLKERALHPQLREDAKHAQLV